MKLMSLPLTLVFLCISLFCTAQTNPSGEQKDFKDRELEIQQRANGFTTYNIDLSDYPEERLQFMESYVNEQIDHNGLSVNLETKILTITLADETFDENKISKMFGVVRLE